MPRQWVQAAKQLSSSTKLNKTWLRQQFKHSTSVCTSILPCLFLSPSLYFYQGHHPWCCYHGDKPRRAVGETCEGLWLNVCVFSRMCAQLFALVYFFVNFLMLIIKRFPEFEQLKYCKSEKMSGSRLNPLTP